MEDAIDNSTRSYKKRAFLLREFPLTPTHHWDHVIPLLFEDVDRLLETPSVARRGRTSEGADPAREQVMSVRQVQKASITTNAKFTNVVPGCNVTRAGLACNAYNARDAHSCDEV